MTRRNQNSDNLNEYIRKILKLLDERGWSKADLARHSGVSTGTICNMIARNTKPTSDTLEKYCQAFGITPDEFYQTSPKRRPDFYVLNEDERKVIDIFRITPDSRKDILLREIITISNILRGR